MAQSYKEIKRELKELKATEAAQTCLEVSRLLAKLENLLSGAGDLNRPASKRAVSALEDLNALLAPVATMRPAERC
jgi:hypothetical protein